MAGRVLLTFCNGYFLVKIQTYYYYKELRDGVVFGELSFELIIKSFQGLLFKSIPMLYAPNIQQVRINSHNFANKKGTSLILAPFQKITHKQITLRP